MKPPINGVDKPKLQAEEYSMTKNNYLGR